MSTMESNTVLEDLRSLLSQKTSRRDTFENCGSHDICVDLDDSHENIATDINAEGTIQSSVSSRVAFLSVAPLGLNPDMYTA